MLYVMFLAYRILSFAPKHLHLYKHISKYNSLVAVVDCNIKPVHKNLCIKGPNVQFTRGYAKGKDKKKDKAKVKIQINENQISEIINIESLKNQMQKSVEVLKDEFVKHLSLRSSAGSIESLVVNVDGKDHILQELAQIVRKNPKMVVINLSVYPQAIPATIKAIQKSGMNLNPQQDGTTLFIPVPKVTKEHREGLAKNAKQLFIKCRDNIKDTQMKHIKVLKKKQISEDEIRNIEQQLLALADDYINTAQTIFNNKQNELLGKD